MIIILINGTYGVGKTIISKKLNKKLGKENSLIIEIDKIYSDQNQNLERILKYGAKAYPQADKESFKIVKEKIEKSSKKYIILPMCITEEIGVKFINKLKIKYDLIHYILTADRDVIKERIINDSERIDKSLALDNLENNLNFLENNFKNAIRISTNDRNTDDISDEILLYLK